MRMACESAQNRRMVPIAPVRHDVFIVSAEFDLIRSFKAPSKAWLEDQGENVRRQTSSSAAMRYDDDDFKPLPVVKKVPGTFLALSNCQSQAEFGFQDMVRGENVFFSCLKPIFLSNSYP